MELSVSDEYFVFHLQPQEKYRVKCKFCLCVWSAHHRLTTNPAPLMTSSVETLKASDTYHACITVKYLHETGQIIRLRWLVQTRIEILSHYSFLGTFVKSFPAERKKTQQFAFCSCLATPKDGIFALATKAGVVNIVAELLYDSDFYRSSPQRFPQGHGIPIESFSNDDGADKGKWIRLFSPIFLRLFRLAEKVKCTL